MASTAFRRIGWATPARAVACAFALAWAAGCGGGSGEQGALDPGSGDGGADDASLGDGGGATFDVGTDGGGACKPRTCEDVGANCGPVADGCGGLTADCGTCAAGTVCGGGGTPSVCGTTVGDGGGCVPTTCEKAGVNCGPIGDGCGGVIECGTCPAGLSCGGGGTPSVCGVTVVPADGGTLGDGGTCVPKTCADYPGKNCGPIADGCGGVVDCGTCTVAGEICGATESNVCGNPYADGGGCKPKTCADLGFNCGKAGDGCGGELNCGTCSAPFICGGVEPSKCGNPYADDAGVVCKKKNCADYGATCGWIGDGCGGTEFCGNCTAPDICGGGGVPSKCGGGSADGGTVPGCTDPLCDKIPLCTSGTETSITGTVYAPNGIEPLYNAVVYIPKGTVEPFPDTISCDRCDTPRPAIASAVTGPDGKFTLKGAIPAGTNIPIVIELGRWRRYHVIPNVAQCVPNPLPAASTRLPKKQEEFHVRDNIPRMAMVTGSVDALECVLRKIGIDDSAFGNPTTTDRFKRIQFYQDNGARINGSTPSWTSLVDDSTTMSRFDAIILACRASERDLSGTTNGNRMARLRAYADAGGRVFATHWSRAWIRQDSTWTGVATWGSGNGATSGDGDPLVSDVVTTFTKGTHFAQWLSNVGALSSPLPTPKVEILASRTSISDLPTASKGVKWITSPSSPDVKTVQHMTFNTPYTATDPKNYCGRVLFSDFHVNNASVGTSTNFPSECTAGGLTDQEKILEFMLFDLASCVNGDNLPPPPAPTCTPKTCADVGAECGQVADGCGDLTASCGTCTKPGETCGGAGVPGKCGGAKCTPKTCTDYGYECGPAGDGCGKELNCGPCTKAGETCGGGGVAQRCGAPTCTPKTCGDFGATCGYVANGCGSSAYCGDCTVPGETCGGGGVSGKCGAPTCTPITCADVGATCGWIGDGCGDKTFCGDCTVAGETCGGAGIPGVCGKPSTTPCVPRTCTDVGAKCGPAGDGCGGLLDCGTCVAPETCGGGGVPNKCGGGPR